ncbi:MAG: type II toxin-antitoxin system VapC family toxin [Calditrichaeota bacterium]|nr:MAG: type II toxin-antitoxin system VapC family toxin [Calditrichota bacterium]
MYNLRYLLDTHALLWLIDDSTLLGTAVKEVYLDEDNIIFLSMASIWEIAIKKSGKKLQIPGSLSEFVTNHVRGNKIDLMPIELNHLYQLENLMFNHKDPFDRLIISQAIAENIPVLSKDKAFDDYPVERVW